MKIKQLTAVFGAGVLGILMCLIMTIYTGVQEHRKKSEPTPISIPMPALGR